MAVPAEVYVVHTAEGELLYVGVTRSLRNRMAVHKTKSAWWSASNVITVEHFEKRADAERRESELIETLKPPFNPPRKRVLGIPDDVRADVDRLAAELGITAAAYVEEALREKNARVERRKA